MDQVSAVRFKPDFSDSGEKGDQDEGMLCDEEILRILKRRSIIERLCFELVYR